MIVSITSPVMSKGLTFIELYKDTGRGTVYGVKLNMSSMTSARYTELVVLQKGCPAKTVVDDSGLESR
jgi:hypothetical protein